MFKVVQPLNVDIMEQFPSPLPCHLQHNVSRKAMQTLPQLNKTRDDRKKEC